MGADHPTSDICGRNLGLVDWYSHIDHANPDSVYKTTDKQHGGMDGSGLYDGGDDADDAGDLDSKTSTETIQQPRDNQASDDTTTCEESIVGWNVNSVRTLHVILTHIVEARTANDLVALGSPRTACSQIEVVEERRKTDDRATDS